MWVRLRRESVRHAVRRRIGLSTLPLARDVVKAAEHVMKEFSPISEP